MILIRNYDEAKKTENAVMSMDGDSGGQIYVVAPMKYVKCSESVLKQLLNDLDLIAWEHDEVDALIFYEVAEIGGIIGGGMGGGKIIDGIWVHDEFVEKGYKEQIIEIISGKKERLNF
jgi:hypothetical protein